MAWRLKTTPVRGVPDAVRVSAEPIDPDAMAAAYGAHGPELVQLPAPEPAPSPEPEPDQCAVGRWHPAGRDPALDDALVDALREQLAARDLRIAQLETQLNAGAKRFFAAAAPVGLPAMARPAFGFLRLSACVADRHLIDAIAADRAALEAVNDRLRADLAQLREKARA